MISVIVPLYNVESYVRECLDSLLVQIQADVEFILIDDGSTDRTGSIADEYAEKDSRFRVIHTVNKGLSAARNCGIEEARGEWLMFLDGDDYVIPGFCVTPYKVAQETGADIVVFKYARLSEGKFIPSKECRWTEGEQGKGNAIKNGLAMAWNKIYRSNLFEGIRYPEGMVYEDLATTYKLIDACSKVVFSEECLYVYRERSGSISKRKNAKTLYDGLAAAVQRRNDMIEMGYTEDLNRPVETRAWDILVLLNPSGDVFYQLALEEIGKIRGIPNWMSLKQKLIFLVWRMNKKLFQFIRNRFR